MRLEFHPEAALELIETALHYEQQVPELGRRFEAEVRHVTNLLLDHPEMGQQVDPDLRRIILPRFPFSLIYSVAADTLRIEAVTHQSRLPGYWKTRTDSPRMEKP